MKCVICRHGETRVGRIVATLQRGETTVILKGVPVEVCDNCGEYYLSEQIAAVFSGGQRWLWETVPKSKSCSLPPETEPPTGRRHIA